MTDVKPRFTQRMMMHLNGGKEYSLLQFEVLRDGKPTGITRTRTTNGSPQYEITSDIFRCEDSEFDVTEEPRGSLQAWLEAHSKETP